MDKVVKEIEQWFQEQLCAGLILPTGWNGRPYDNVYRLTFVAGRPRWLMIELDDNSLFVITDLKECKPSESELTLSGFTQFVRHNPGGDTFDPSMEVFTEGSIQFVSLRPRV
ncbi:hypothetical protein [Thermoactinomyces sp. DSM 45892]|uniref:hypothetical protein n=1 Tax=Thermoactinomyces sp. DSM 45892 TaxID=1882753 RepID=UPI000894D51B|nr:hypothetical protein [Thermoactinomyces sp. DSM 45892]SDZ34879.1 hypothetical protein SAMN05444416_1243 [Thermoactinomyces sp. DSM 45892]